MLLTYFLMLLNTFFSDTRVGEHAQKGKIPVFEWAATLVSPSSIPSVIARGSKGLDAGRGLFARERIPNLIASSPPLQYCGMCKVWAGSALWQRRDVTNCGWTLNSSSWASNVSSDFA